MQGIRHERRASIINRIRSTESRCRAPAMGFLAQEVQEPTILSMNLHIEGIPYIPIPR